MAIAVNIHSSKNFLKNFLKNSLPKCLKKTRSNDHDNICGYEANVFALVLVACTTCYTVESL